MKQLIISFELLIIAILVLLLLARVDQFYSASIDDIWIVVFSLAFITTGVIIIKSVIKKHSSIVQQRPSLINHDQMAKAGISDREGEILLLIDEGLSNEQIAGKLFIAESTVKRHLTRVSKKLHTDCRTGSVKKAKEMSILL
ncbi:regulatory protein, luxR family [Mucilaginibacter mallensis]|uniref:Regulatory protein, luxR family n=1 Tax=Mucilaginibacter mallensis TaxID=652787 RepID=A0A1H1X2Y0_MUCMA|nr:LuxR C-terminal-related transcriptional regulator [Mucilaginibacter mallensis]SDT03411.1 regulatory protein, luxR family [Mucilaginibacter mallensis]